MTSIDSTINSMTNATTLENATKTASDGKKSSLLNQDAFLQLMITQLKNQDPTNPTDTNSMLTQEAMITQTGYLATMADGMATLKDSISSISASSATNSLLQSSNLIGKTVTATDPDDSKSTISGTVSAVTYGNDDVKLTVGDHTVSLDALQSVSE
jgi:flagellar basal-body rod modification protein FlgD